jgi:unsaturated rhamnogalacturonyl hydrolase
MTHDLLLRVARRTCDWNFHVWGFGEAIAVRGLIRTSEVTGNPEPRAFAYGLIRAWMGRGVAKTPEDHIAPGRELLSFYALTGDARMLEGARAFAAAHAAHPVGAQGARCHRSDTPGWRHQIWVDCMDIDGPFLAALAVATGEQAYFAAAVDAALGYARTLQDAASGLLNHGHERDAGLNGAHWARGNGWALMGMVDTLTLLPTDQPGRDELSQRLVRQV